ncbi:cellulase family glycosylhydrolase [uncultured Arthrobacter sp.]|uniref:glycoside hydrolase family 5 protein n=1 Tax=uncultured Arthrobacter sp. TaxID=114050 RepID=UPI003216C6A6
MPGSGDPQVQHEPRSPDRDARRRRWPGWVPAVLLLVVPLLVIAGCTLSRNNGSSPAAETGPDFVTASGRGLVLNGEPTRLKAVNFSNLYHRNLNGAELLTSQHHSEEDFARAKDIGFNSIRFAFDGDWYADSPQVFWQWLDQNVAWARQHGMRLILDLHTPIGGFWLDPTSDAVSFDLWSDPRLQQQNADLWRAIAARYKDEPAIAAYDLLNEPVTTDATGEQWKRLARQLVAAVRAEDPNHLLVVGGIYGVNGRYGASGVDQHFLVDDSNVVYDFHFYEPIKYTHQYASWVEGPVQDGGRYPDPDTILPTGQRVLLPGSRIATKPLPAGTSDWAAYDSGIVTIDDSSALAAAPLATAQGGMRGTASFDAIRVTEYGPDGTEIRRVINDPLDRDAALDWHQWQYGGAAGAPPKFAREKAGYRDDGSLSISDAMDAKAIAGWSNDAHLFKVVPGNKYRIQGHMRGQNIEASAGSAPRIGLQLDVYAQSPGTAGNGFLARDKGYLAHEVGKRVQFGIDNNVPMSVMEFGLVRQAFEMEGKGGGQWVTDMLDLLAENDLSFAYWEYHGTQMGLYLSGSGQPSEPNQALLDTLARGLR